MKIVCTCRCGGVVERASRLYREQFGESPTIILKGSDAIRRHKETLSTSSNIYHYLDALAKIKHKFIYSIEYDEVGNITEIYDLQKKVRLA